MQDSNKSVFRQGFVFGFGLIIPLVIGFITYNIISYKMSKSLYEDNYSELYTDKEEKKIESIEILNFRDVREGDFVMVVGAIKNIGKTKVGSIKLEAEFFNSNGEFVYEQTEYVSKRLSPDEVENFSIKCGCTNRKFLEYAKVTVRVVSTSSY